MMTWQNSKVLAYSVILSPGANQNTMCVFRASGALFCGKKIFEKILIFFAKSFWKKFVDFIGM